jgi:hypothetical protein
MHRPVERSAVWLLKGIYPYVGRRREDQFRAHERELAEVVKSAWIERTVPAAWTKKALLAEGVIVFSRRVFLFCHSQSRNEVRVGEVFFGGDGECDPANAARQIERALSGVSAEPVEVVERVPLLPFPPRTEGIWAGANPPAVVTHVVAAFGMFFARTPCFDIMKTMSDLILPLSW